MPNSGLHLILILTLENSVFLQPGLVILQISQYLPEVPCCSSNRDRSLRSSKWSGSPGCAGNTEGTSQLCFLDEESRNKYFFVLYVSIKKKKKNKKKRGRGIALYHDYLLFPGSWMFPDFLTSLTFSNFLFFSIGSCQNCSDVLERPFQHAHRLFSKTILRRT